MVRLRAVLAATALVVSSLLATVLLLEVSLRNFPALWPRGIYGGAYQFSSDLSLSVRSTPSIYNREGWNRRVPNGDGFLDVSHAREKPSGVTRVGFFGDSFVEAVRSASRKPSFADYRPRSPPRPSKLLVLAYPAGAPSIPLWPTASWGRVTTWMKSSTCS
ncbi:MAG: hypothetical protein M3O61_12935 [Gemmatimonadota bacterium]|nr:hypothetical protein [Gemmatimonadota bacterium]